MAHLNILNISRELSKLSDNVKSLNQDNNTLGVSVDDLNEIKANKKDICLVIETLKDNIKKMNNKINNINKEVRIISNRDMDFVNKNTKEFNKFLIDHLNLSKKKINVIIFVLECHNQQDFLLIDYNDVSHYDFSEKEFNLIQTKCCEYLENISNFESTD